MSALDLAPAASPCPPWCVLPAGHDVPQEPNTATEVVHREHYRPVFEDDDLAYVGLVQLDVALGDEQGPTYAGAACIEMSTVERHPMSPVRARWIARALAQAAALLDGGAAS